MVTIRKNKTIALSRGWDNTQKANNTTNRG